MIELNKIYNEDCLVGMANITDASIDCIICDLPYGTTQNQWDSVISLDDLWLQYKRVIKKNGAIVLFSQMPFTAILACSNLEMLKYEIVWQKENATGFLNSNFAPMKIHENILVFSKSSAGFVKDKSKAMVYNPQMVKGCKPYVCKQGSQSKNYGKQNSKPCITVSNGDRFPTDIVSFGRDKEKIHPTQKPVDLIRYLVRTYTNEGDLVLDNCSGSGTTAIACIREKRNFIGFELNKEYYDNACKRIQLEMMQPSLF